MMKKSEALFISLIILLLFPQLSLAQVNQEELEQESGIRLSFEQAVRTFESIYQSSSILEFERMINTLNRRMSEGELSAELKTILLKSHEYRARAYFNSGQLAKASEDFSAIIRLEQKYSLDKKLVSPKIITLFEEVKRDNIGYIVVKSEPPGANVKINNEVIGITNLFQTPYLKGTYPLEVELPGYKVESSMVNILPEQTLELSYEMVRNSAAGFFITQPSGVEIIIDGKSYGITSGPPDPSFIEKAEELGLDFEKISSEFKIENIPLGTHTIEFRKECFETIQRQIRFDSPEDYNISPAILESSLAHLTINSSPNGADIYLNDKLLGKTPAELNNICSGNYKLVLKHSHGKHIQDIELKKDQRITIDCTLKPTLAFLGLIPESELQAALLSEIERQIKELLLPIDSFNFIDISPTAVNSLLNSMGLNILDLTEKASENQEKISDMKMVEAVNYVANQIDAELLITAYIPDVSQARSLFISVISPGNPKIESFKINLLSQLDTSDLTTVLNTSIDLYKSWLGLRTIDTLLYTGVAVLSITPNSPAAFEDIKQGDVIQAADEIKINHTLDLLNYLKDKKPEQTITLEVKSPDKIETKDIILGRSPVEIPLNSTEISYSKLMAELRHVTASSSDPNIVMLGNYNLGMVYMHFHQWAEAIEQFKKVTLEGETGIGKGTLLYRMAQCYENLNFREEAIAAYREVTRYKECTLRDNDGPLVAPLAERALVQLER